MQQKESSKQKGLNQLTSVLELQNQALSFHYGLGWDQTSCMTPLTWFWIWNQDKKNNYKLLQSFQLNHSDHLLYLWICAVMKKTYCFLLCLWSISQSIALNLPYLLCLIFIIIYVILYFLYNFLYPFYWPIFHFSTLCKNSFSELSTVSNYKKLATIYNIHSNPNICGDCPKLVCQYTII